MLCYSYMLITLLTRKGSAFYWSEEHFKKGRGLGGREGRKKNKKKLLFWYTLGEGWFEETLFHFRFEKGRHFTSDRCKHPPPLFVQLWTSYRSTSMLLAGERASEQNTFIIKYYLAKIFTRV